MMYKGLSGHEELIAEATRIAHALVKDTDYQRWRIDCEIYPLDDDPTDDTGKVCTSRAAAICEAEPAFRRARIRIAPKWLTRTILGLEELMAHEIGHVCIWGPFDAIEKARALTEAEEEVANRVGQLLLEKTRAAGDLP